jgi:hypothetical protein
MYVIVNRKARVFRPRTGERVTGSIGNCRCARSPLGGWFLHSAEPDIHLLPQASMGRRRRLSLCCLRVPKQYEESLVSRLRRPAGHLRDLAACASIPDVFPFPGRVVYAAAVRRNSARGHEIRIVSS